MGKPLMIQIEDEEKIENLKDKLKLRTKVDVVRAGLELLEREMGKRDRILRWKRAASLVSKVSNEVNKDFRAYSRLKRS